MPPTRMFAVKRYLLRWAGADIGTNVRVVSSARFVLTGHLEIGENTWIGHEVLIIGGDAAVRIGAEVDIGPRVSLVTGTHEVSESSYKAAGPGYSLPIDIGEGAWLGAMSTILGGVRVGERSIVAAGALVHRDVTPSTVVAGVPARRIRKKEDSN